MINAQVYLCSCFPSYFDHQQALRHEGYPLAKLPLCSPTSRSLIVSSQCSSLVGNVSCCSCQNGLLCGLEGAMLSYKHHLLCGLSSFSLQTSRAAYSGQWRYLGLLGSWSSGSEREKFQYALGSLHTHLFTGIKRSSGGEEFVASSGRLHNGQQSNASSIQVVPLFLPGGLTIEDWGTIYHGDNEEKYYNWKSATKHPYPVGYIAEKVYKGSTFRQTIEAGREGPIFTVQVGEASFSAASPTKAWTLACNHHLPSSASVIRSHRHYGFENKYVLQKLSLMQMEHAEKCISKSHILRKSTDTQHTLEQVSGKINGEQSTNIEENETFESVDGEEQKMPTHDLKKDMLLEGPNKNKRSTSNHGFSAPDCKIPNSRSINEDLLGKMVRVRSKLLKATVTQKEDMLSLMRNLVGLTRQQPARNISASSTTHSGIISVSNYSDSSDSEDVDARLTVPDVGGLPRHSGGFASIAQNMVVDMKIDLQEGHSYEDIAPTSFELLDVAQSRSKAPSLWESSLFKGNAKGVMQSCTALEELLQFWRETEMFSGEQIQSMGNETSFLTDNDKANETKTAEDSEELSDINDEGSLIKVLQGFLSTLQFDKAASLFRRHNINGVQLSNVLFPFELDNWQTLALQYLDGQESVLVCAPVGAGKSIISTCWLYHCILKDQRAIFVTPFTDLANQQFFNFQKIFGENLVGGAWEATRLRMHAKILVVTLEFLVRELRENVGVETMKRSFPFEEFSVLVLDKFFVAVEGKLGSFWEEIMMLMETQVQLLALSLPAKNADNLVSWINNTHRSCKLVKCDSMPVPKKYYFLNSTGLHKIADRKSSAMNGSLKLSLISSDLATAKEDQKTAFEAHPDLRSIANTLHERFMLPAAIFCHDPEECTAAVTNISKAVSNRFLFQHDNEVIQKRLDNLFEASPEYRSLSKEDCASLRFGIVAHHNQQLPFWRQFVDSLIQDDLVQIVVATQSLLSRTKKLFKTVVFSLTQQNIFNEDFMRKVAQHQGLAGRRGLDTYGNVIFLGSPSTSVERMGVFSLPLIEFSSHFRPSYALMVNLLLKYDSTKVKEVIERNFSAFSVEAIAEKELDSEHKPEPEGAAVFTRVDVKLTRDMQKTNSFTLPGVILAIVPGPRERLYVTLCSDNKFRLVPAGALKSVYLEEPPLDLAHQLAAGNTLKQPSLPKRRTWLPDPSCDWGYVVNGTRESAQLVDVLRLHSINFEGKAGKEKLQKDAIWEEAQKKISVLERTSALPQATSVKHGPLAALVTGLHYLENELWVSTVLTSSFLKPLTPPELASICSTLVCKAENLEPFNKLKSSFRVPKRIQETLNKVKALRENVANLEGSSINSLCFDMAPAALVHAWLRGKPGVDNFRFRSVNDGAAASILEDTMRLLERIGRTCSDTSRKGQDLEGFLGLASISRRAAYLLNRYLSLEDISGYTK